MGKASRAKHRAAEPAKKVDRAANSVLPLAPRQVLDLFGELYDGLRHPADSLLRYFRYFMEDAIIDKAEDSQDSYERWGVMFQPATTPAQWAMVLTRQCINARVFQVTAEMVDAVNAMYENTSRNVYHFQGEDIPWPSGFVYLDKAAAFSDRWGKLAMNRALSWSMETAHYEGDQDDKTIPAVRIVCWSWYDDRDDYWSKETGRREMNEGLGGLSFAHAVTVPFGQRFRLPGEGDFTKGVEPGDISRWLHCLWLLLGSEIVTSKRAQDVPSRPMRTPHSLRHGEVNVVQLRRTHSLEVDEEHGTREVDWSCRWPVQGFWRHRTRRNHHAAPDPLKVCCIVCGEAISWVRPHLRGPSDLPLREQDQLYKLSR